MDARLPRDAKCKQVCVPDKCISTVALGKSQMQKLFTDVLDCMLENVFEFHFTFCVTNAEGLLFDSLLMSA